MGEHDPILERFEEEVLLPAFNKYLESSNIPFMIFIASGSDVLTLLHQKYNAPSKFLEQFGHHHIFDDSLIEVDFWDKLRGGEHFTTKLLTIKDTKSELSSRESEIRYLKRELRKREIWNALLILAIIVGALYWRFSRL